MDKVIVALSAVAGLAAVTVAMVSSAASVRSAPDLTEDTVLTLAASRFEVIPGGVGAAPLRKCVVIDPAGVGTNHEAGRVPTMQVLPTSCP